MKNYLYVLVLLFVFSSCTTKIEKQISQEEIKDSTFVILHKIIGKWNDSSPEKLPKSDMIIPTAKNQKLNISYYELIETGEILNELIVYSNLEVLKDGSWKIAPFSYEAKVDYKAKKFGFKIKIDSLYYYIGINKLNDSILLFENGQKYTRVN